MGILVMPEMFRGHSGTPSNYARQRSLRAADRIGVAPGVATPTPAGQWRGRHPGVAKMADNAMRGREVPRVFPPLCARGGTKLRYLPRISY